MKIRGPPKLIHELRKNSFRELNKLLEKKTNISFGRVVMHGAPKIINKQTTLAEKAIKLSYSAAHLADHAVQGEKKAIKLIEKREPTPQELTKVWEEQYAEAIENLLSKINNSQEVRKTLETKIERYTQPPKSILKERKAHWGRIKRILENINAKGLEYKIESILVSKRTPKAKAQEIALTASLLTDKIAYETKNPNWESVYSQIMLLLYKQISKSPRVLDEIINLK